MNKILLGLLCIGSTSAFASVGDVGLKSAPVSILKTNAMLVDQQSLYMANSNTQKSMVVTYASFSNKNNKVLNADLSNINKGYFASKIRINNDVPYIVNMSVFNDANGFAVGKLYSKKGEAYGFGVNLNDIYNLEFTLIRKKLFNEIANEDLYSKLLTRISISRNSYNTMNMIGFVLADNQNDLKANICTAYLIGEDFQLIGYHGEACFDI